MCVLNGIRKQTSMFKHEELRHKKLIPFKYRSEAVLKFKSIEPDFWDGKEEEWLQWYNNYLNAFREAAKKDRGEL